MPHNCNWKKDFKAKTNKNMKLRSKAFLCWRKMLKFNYTVTISYTLTSIIKLNLLLNTLVTQKTFFLSCLLSEIAAPLHYVLPHWLRPFMQIFVTLTEVGAASLSSDKYFFKGVFKALAPVPEAEDNLCNKSRRLSDRSADTDAELAEDTTRRGELGVRLSQGTD